ncbi:MAG: hypothetical protein M3065_04045 [Actinomycetota bacterium]|nr:hypothetical protein [Actinomycetota bacterium]
MAAVFLAGGGSAFSLCVSAVPLACAGSSTRLGAALSAAIVLAAAAAPSAAWMRLHPLPAMPCATSPSAIR